MARIDQGTVVLNTDHRPIKLESNLIILHFMDSPSAPLDLRIPNFRYHGKSIYSLFVKRSRRCPNHHFLLNG